MSRTNRSSPVLRAAMMTAPLLLALGGCAAVPIAEFAASGAGNQGMAQGMTGAIGKFMPGLANGQTEPCTRGTADAASGCGPAAQQPVLATKTPVAAATDGQTTACGANDSSTSVAGCDAGGMGTMVHGLAGSLEKLVPGSLFSH